MKRTDQKTAARRKVPMHRSPITALVAVVVIGVAIGLSTGEKSPSSHVEQATASPFQSDACGGILTGRACRIESAIEGSFP